MSLKKFIQQENRLEQFMGRGPKYPEDLDLLLPRHKEELTQRVASALSPECLTCDGELRGAKLQAKARMLNAAKDELVAMGMTCEWW